MVSSWVATLLQRGLVIPVERDPATGALTKVASAQLTQELSDRRGEADAIRPKSALDPDVQAVIDLPRDVRKAIKDRAHRGSLEPTEGAIPPPQQPAPASAAGPRPETVEGVPWHTAVAVAAYLETHPASSTAEADAAGQIHGLIPGTWATVRSAWEARIASEPGLTELWAWDAAQARGARN